MSGAAAACASMSCAETTGPGGFPPLTGPIEVAQLRGRWVGTTNAITVTLNIVAVDSGEVFDGVKPYFTRGSFQLVDRSTATASSFSTQSLNLQCMNNEVALARCMKANEPLKLWLAQGAGSYFYDDFQLRLTSSRSMVGWLHWRMNYLFFTLPDSERVAMARIGEATP